jgi:hypothetical protein
MVDNPLIPGGWTLPLVLASAFILAVIARAALRRRRRIDPRELAFQRLIRTRGWSRDQVRALRHAGEAMGLASPVGIALSPMLTVKAFEADARPADRKDRPREALTHG